MDLKIFKKKLDRILGYPLSQASARVRRALGFDKLAYELYMSSEESRDKIQRKLDRLLGDGAGKIPPRVKRGLGFEALEHRLVMSATLGADDGILNWTDADGATQALDVTNGTVEVHFTDDTGNTGDITEVKLLTDNAGFDVTTTDIDMINSNGNNVGNLNIGVAVGGEAADTQGQVDSILATNDVVGQIYVSGDVGSMSVGNNVQQSITVDGDLGSLSTGGQIHGSVTADDVTGSFSLSDTDFSYSESFGETNQVTFNGATNSLEALDAAGQAVRAMSPSQFRYLSADQVTYLSAEQLASITNAYDFYNMSSDARGALNATQVQSLDTALISIGYLNNAQREDLTADQIQAVSQSRLRYVPASQVQHITADQFASITNASYFYNMSSDARGALNATQVQALDTALINIGYLTTAQREELTPDQIQEVSQSRLRYVPASQVQHITTDQLASITNASYFYNMSSDARGATGCNAGAGARYGTDQHRLPDHCAVGRAHTRSNSRGFPVTAALRARFASATHHGGPTRFDYQCQLFLQYVFRRAGGAGCNAGAGARYGTDQHRLSDHCAARRSHTRSNPRGFPVAVALRAGFAGTAHHDRPTRFDHQCQLFLQYVFRRAGSTGCDAGAGARYGADQHWLLDHCAA